MRRNRLPDNFSSLPKLSTIDGLESYIYSGARDYFRGWATFHQLEPQQQRVIELLNDGLNGRLEHYKFTEYKSTLQYLKDQGILSTPELTILQRRGIKNNFINQKSYDLLEEAGVHIYEDETDGDFFRSKRDQLFGLEQIDPNEAFVTEEMLIQTALENEFSQNGRVAAENTLKDIFSGEQKIAGVKQQWLNDYAGIHSEAEVPVELQNFFRQMPEEVNQPITGQRPTITEWEPEFDDFVNEEDIYYSAGEDELILPEQEIEMAEFGSPRETREELFYDVADEESALLPRREPIAVEMAEFDPPRAGVEGKALPIDPFAAEPYSADIMRGRMQGDEVTRQMLRDNPEWSNEQLIKQMQGISQDQPMKFETGRVAESYKGMYRIWDDERANLRAPALDAWDPDVVARQLDVSQLSVPERAALAQIPGWEGVGESLWNSAVHMSDYLKNMAIGGMISAPVFSALNKLLGDTPRERDAVNLTVGGLGLLASGDPLGLILAGASVVVGEFNRQAVRADENNTAGSYYGKHFGYVRSGNRWYPAFTTKKDDWTGFGVSENTTTMEYGEGLYFALDRDGKYRPYFSNLKGTKEFNRDDATLEGDLSLSRERRNGLDDMIWLSDDDQKNLLQYFADPQNNELKIDSPGGTFDSFEDTPKLYDTQQNLQFGAYQEDLRSLSTALDYIQSFHLHNVPESERETVRATVPANRGLLNKMFYGIGVDFTGTLDEQRKQISNGQYWNMHSDDTYLTGELLDKVFDDLYRTQRNAAEEQGFGDQTRPFLSSEEHPWDTYRDYVDPFELPYANNSGELKSQLQQIEQLDRTDKQKAFLGNKAMGRYYLKFLTDHGSTDAVFRKMYYRDPHNTNDTSLSGLIEGTPRGFLQSGLGNRLLPTMNRGEKLIPDFMYDTLPDQWEKDWVDTVSNTMWNWFDEHNGSTFPAQELEVAETEEEEQTIRDPETKIRKPKVVDEGLERFKTALLKRHTLLPNWLVKEMYTGKAKPGVPKYKIKIKDRADAILTIRRIFTKSDRPDAKKGEKERCAFLYSTLQSILPELTQPIVNESPALFTEKIAFNEVSYLKPEYDVITNAHVLPQDFIPNLLEGHDRDQYKAMIAHHMGDSNAMNKLLPVYEELIQKSRDEAMSYGGLAGVDISKPQTLLAVNRLGLPVLWDDPSLPHGKFQKAVQFLDGSTHYQMGIQPPEHISFREKVHYEPPKTLPTSSTKITEPPQKITLQHV